MLVVIQTISYTRGRMSSTGCRQNKGSQVDINEFKEKHILAIGNNKEKIDSVFVRGKGGRRRVINRSFSAHHGDNITFHNFTSIKKNLNTSRPSTYTF